MKRYLFLLCFLLMPVLALYGQEKKQYVTSDSVTSRLVIIGDAGELTADFHHTVVEAVEKLVPLDKKTTVLYIGDNLYRHGLPEEERANYVAARAVLDSQANIADHAKGMVYFIPGNHDWMNGQPGGYNAVLRQQNYLAGLGKKNLRFYPEDGCPGPIAVDIGTDVVMIMMDSQWWLHQNEKPGIESDCAQKTKEEVLSELRNILTDNYKKLVIFACHHPFKSNGIHGGYYTWKQHIFPFTDIKKNLYIPLPVIGSIYPISRGVFGTQEDISYPAYQNMISSIEDVLKGHPNVVRIAGHEHALEWLVDSNRNYIVSGSGCKTTRVSRSKKSKFVASSLGFTLLDMYADKTVHCTFVAAAADSFGKALYTDTMLNYAKLPPVKGADTTLPIVEFRDSVLVQASHRYDETSGFRNLVMGSNYREEWATPVMLKSFHLDKEKGGLKITGAGGGFQTKTLHLVGGDGRRYNLRSIDKDPTKVLPPNMRESFAKDVVRDMISAAHPYAPLAVSSLADAEGIVAAKPEFFFVPDDPAFGFYRPLFVNTVCLLEPGDPTDDNKKTKSTAKVISKILGDNDHFVDQREVLRARLLDMLIGDWDRHFDQWKWGVGDTGKGKLYYPIPRDRDQAFFNSNGLIMKAATQHRVPWMKGFRSKYNKFNWLSYSARDFDRMFLNQLSRSDWESSIDTFVTKMTDAEIKEAVAQMPPEMQAISGAAITGKLESRRGQLKNNALKYYNFISRKVSVLGSNRNEYFSVKNTDTGVLVQVHAREEGKDTTLLMYNRTFDPKITKEIRLWGFNGADRFTIDEDVRTKIRIRMIGGPGNDTFDVQGRAHSHIYDISREGNAVMAHRHTDQRFTPDPSANAFLLQDFHYNDNRYPTINVGYNPDDGVLAGLGFLHRTYGFRKQPFETEQRLTTLFSFERKAYQLRYRSQFTDVFKGNDILFNADFQNPALYNFYGLGNNTKPGDTTTPADYHTRFNFLSADLLLQKRPFKKVLSIAAGPSFYYYWNDREINNENMLQQPETLGLDSNDIFHKKLYAGGKLNILINNLNSDIFPTRGIFWNNSFTAYRGLNDFSKPLTELHSDMSVFASLADPASLVAVLRLGGGHIYSKSFEFFQAENVGANNVLRGFRKNRFSGRSMAYGSIELRGKLGEIKSYILPGDFGIVGFDDIARVWTDGEQSRRWHNAPGVGVYFLPFNMFIISSTAAFGEEGTLFNLSIGTRLNLIF